MEGSKKDKARYCENMFWIKNKRAELKVKKAECDRNWKHIESLVDGLFNQKIKFEEFML